MVCRPHVGASSQGQSLPFDQVGGLIHPSDHMPQAVDVELESAGKWDKSHALEIKTYSWFAKDW